MKQTELNEILRKHQLYLEGKKSGVRANLYRTDLEGANLEGVDLQYANLYRTDLEGANLRGVNLSRANLEGANLQRSDLSGANLEGANLYSSNLRGANLYRANLYRADLEGANLQEANLQEANLLRADLRRANLYNVISDYIVLKSITGMKWVVVMMDDKVKVGCKKYTYKEWKSFNNEEISEMDSGALDFYPMLIQVLDYHYKGTKFEIKE